MRPVHERTIVAVPPRLLAAGAGVIYVADLLLWLLSPARFVVGVLDETAHVATAVVVLAQTSRKVSLALAVGLLAGAVLIDVDHIPMELGFEPLTPEGGRPYPHSLPTVAALGFACLVVPRRWLPFLMGATLGVACHLWRDLATAGGVPLLWPLSTASVEVPYLVYAAVQGALAARSLLLDRALTVVSR